LLENSKTRWRGANSGVYAEGMLIAFLTDAALLRESRGKIDLLEIFRRVYQKHRFPENQADGNRAVLEILRSYEYLAPVIEK
jgi:predicted metalloprotease with PDZ domain